MAPARGWLAAITVCSIALCTLAGDPPKGQDSEAPPPDPVQIKILFDALGSTDPESRHTALQGLQAIGRPVLPFLEDRLRLRAGDEYVDLLTSLALLPEKASAGVGADPGEVQKYYLDKTSKARRLYETGEFEKCEQLISAIVLLEPGCEGAQDLRELHRQCEQRIAETKIVRPILVTKSDIYRETDAIDLAFRLDDMTPGPVELDFTGSRRDIAHSPKAAPNFVHADIEIVRYSPFGDTVTTTRSMEWELKENAKPTPAAPWTFVTTIDPMMDGAAKVYRTYSIHAWVRPYSFHTEKGNTPGRQIDFPVVGVGVFPQLKDDLQDIRANAVHKLTEALENNDADSLFLITMLLQAKDKPQAIALLMGTLPRAGERAQQCLMTCLHQLQPLPLENSADAWIGWWKQQQAANQGKPR